MKKEDIIKHVISIGKSEKEVLEKYDEFEKEAIGYGFEGEQVVNHVARRFSQFYIKSKMRTANMVEYVGIFFGCSLSDYGNTKKYNDAVEMFNSSPETAINKCFTDHEGKPLYTNGYNKGKPIDLNDIWSKTCLGIAKPKDSEQDFELCTFNLNKEAIDTDIPFFRLCEFTGTDKKDKDQKLSPSNNNLQEIKILSEELKENDILEITQKHFICKDFSDLKEFAIENPRNYSKYVAIRGNVTSLRPGTDDKNHMISLTDPDINLEELTLDNVEDMNVTAWLSGAVPLTCTETSMDVILYGTPRYNSADDTVSFNALGLYTPEIYRRPSDIEPYTEAEEEVVEKESTVEVVKEDKPWIR